MHCTALPLIEVLPFWIPPTPREIRLKKLNVSPTLYCNVLPLTVYFIGKLMYWQNLPLFDTWINIANWRPGTYSVFRHGRIRHLPPSCRFGGVPVHHDPVDGICTNPGNREWGPSPLSFFVVCAYPIHRVMVNWDPPISQVIHLPGTIQKGNTSIQYRYSTGTVDSLRTVLRKIGKEKKRNGVNSVDIVR